MVKKKKYAFEKFAGDFKTEDEFEEEVEAEGIDPEKAEKEHFEEEER